jgi:adenylate kinase family enzyme
LISYYRDHGKLVEIDGTQPIDQVTDDLMAAMKK